MIPPAAILEDAVRIFDSDPAPIQMLYGANPGAGSELIGVIGDHLITDEWRIYLWLPRSPLVLRLDIGIVGWAFWTVDIPACQTRGGQLSNEGIREFGYRWIRMFNAWDEEPDTDFIQ